jgi:hypothetical protein
LNSCETSALVRRSPAGELLVEQGTKLNDFGDRPSPSDWTFHDIRRTCRSLMSRYTSPDNAERVIGHVVGGVRGTYDHHQYQDEKGPEKT